MRSHHTVSHLPVAGAAGDHDIAPVHPHPHVPSRHEEGIAVVAELAAELAVDPDPLAHGNLPGDLHVAVAEFGIFGKHQPCLFEQHRDAFLRYLLGSGISGLLFHGFDYGSRLWYTITVPDKKGRCEISGRAP